MNDDNGNGALRLPLWKNALQEMREKGVAHGQTWDAEFFETHLKCTRDDMRFGLALSEIRRALEWDGFYLSGRGQNGNQFVILPPESNCDVMAHYSRAATDALRRAVTLGANTDVQKITSEADRKKLENYLRKVSTKAVLMQRSGAVAKILQKEAPALLLK